MKLTKAQEAKTLEVTTAHDYDEKYMVILKEGYSNNSEEVAFFNTQKEIKEFINGAELIEAVAEVAEVAEVETDGEVYEGFYANYVFYTKYRPKIATAREGKFFEGFKELPLSDLHEGIEGVDLLFDTVLKALLKEKDALESGKTVNVYLQWTLSKDHMRYTTCKHVRTEVVEKTVKKRLERRSKSVDCVLGCYDDKLEALTDKALAEVMRYADEEYTDVVVKMNGKQYVVEIATVNNEKDFALYTKSEYIEKYGEEKRDKFD